MAEERTLMATFKASISEAEAAFKTMERRLDDIESVSNKASNSIGQKLSRGFEKAEKAGQRFQNTGKQMTKMITAPALGATAAVAGLTSKLGFDRLVGMDSAKAKLEGLGYSAKKVGGITGQVTKAIEGGMTTMAEGTDIAAGALAAGVKEGKELQHYIKMVGDAAVGANRPVNEMAQIFNRVQGMGKLMTQELNMIEDGMPGFAQAMSKHLNVSQEEFRKMVTDGKVTSEQFLTVMDDFAGGMAEAYANSWQGMVKNTKAYIGIIGEQLLTGVFKSSKSSLKEFIDFLKSDEVMAWADRTGKQLGVFFSDFLNKVKSLIGWFTNLNSSQQKFIGALMGVTIAAGPILLMVGTLLVKFASLGSAILGLVTSVSKAGGLIAFLGQKLSFLSTFLSILTGPVGWITLALLALGTAFFIAYKKSETFRNFVDNIGNKIKFAIEWIKQFSSAILGLFTGDDKKSLNILEKLGLSQSTIERIQKFVNNIKSTFNKVKNEVSGFIKEIMSKFIDFWRGNAPIINQAINNIKQGIKALWDFVKPVLDVIAAGLFEGLKILLMTLWNVIKSSLEYIVSTFKNVWELVKGSVIVAWNMIKGIISGALDVIIGIVKVFAGIFTGNWSKVWEGIKQIVSGQLQIIWSVIRGAFLQIWNFIKFIFWQIWNFIKFAWNTIKSIVVGGVLLIWNSIRTYFNAIWVHTKTIFNLIKSFFVGIWAFIKGVFSRYLSLVFTLIRSIFSRVSTVIRGIFHGIRRFLNWIWSSIFNGIKNILGFIYNSIRNRFNNIYSGIRSIMNKAKDWLINTWNTIKNSIVDTVRSLWNRVKDIFGNMRNGLKNSVSKIKGFFNDMLKGVEKGLNGLIKGINKIGKLLSLKAIPEVNFPKFHTGTQSTHTHNLVTNGKLNRDTMAIVGDKGKGNGPKGFRHEMIEEPNGRRYLTPGTDTLTRLKKGSKIYNGQQTYDYINTPMFSEGSLLGKSVDWITDKAKFVGTKVKDGATTLLDKMGDIWDYASNPGKLFDLITKQFNLDGFRDMQGGIIGDMARGAWKKLKEGVINFFKGGFDNMGGNIVGGILDPDKISYHFGHTAAYTAATGRYWHEGVDFPFIYEPIRTPMGGKLKRMPFMSGGYGNWVKVISGAIEMIFAHLKNFSMTPPNGSSVKPGDVVGLSGNTGFSTGPHLHLGIRQNGKDINPEPWLRKAKAKGSLMIGGQGGNAKVWRPQVIKALKLAGLPTASAYINAWIKQIDTESSGNARAIGGTDGYNDGRAQGLVQVKPGTFNSFKLPGYGNIFNGLDNLIAGMRYANSRYGSKLLSVIGHGHGYANGDIISSPELAWIAEGGFSESIISHDPAHRARSKVLHDRTGELLGFNEEPELLKEIIKLMIENNQFLSINNNHIRKLVDKDGNIYLDGKLIGKISAQELGRLSAFSNYERGG
ncbi:tape measure protein [Staphylococcus xylosus]